MDQRIQTSLIPQKQNPSGSSIARAKKPGTIFYWIGILLFFAAVLFAVGFFVYERVLLSQIAQKKFQIQEEIKNFDSELTTKLSSIKDRVDSGEELISNHLASSLFFSLLESLTVRGVYFNSFEFGVPLDGRASFTAKGEAPSYAVLAFQANVFDDSEYIINPEFSEINLNENGRVVFEISAFMDSRAILYQPDAIVEFTTSDAEEEATTTEETTNEEN